MRASEADWWYETANETLSILFSIYILEVEQ